MRLSHSKLGCILSNPMAYYLNYVQGISKKEEKTALYVGSAVHWGIEHNTEDLSEYFGQDFRTRDTYGKDQLLAESMVHGYMNKKDWLFDQMLTDPNTGEKLELIEENHELYLTGNLDSKKFPDGHPFVGIIDLLLLTNKGFIVCDYKTSTYMPDWNKYLEQVYRYIFLLRKNFPDVPVLKTCIINIRKAGIRQKKTENNSEFLNRLMWEYNLPDSDYVNYHEYTQAQIEPKLLDDYIENLGCMADVAYTIDSERMFYINYGDLEGTYGKSDYYELIYKIPDAYILYSISDYVYVDGQFNERRDCVPIDMLVTDLHAKIMNKYSLYKEHIIENKESLDDWIHDDSLIELYKETYKKECETT